MMVMTLIAQAVGPNTDQVNLVMDGTLGTLAKNFDQIQSASAQILVSLAIFEFSIMLLYQLVSPSAEDLLKSFLQKFLATIVVMFLTLNWGMVTGAIQGYVVGTAGSGAGVDNAMGQGLHPGAIAEQGVQKVALIFNPEGRERITNAFLGERPVKQKDPPRKAESDSIFDLGVSDKMGSLFEQMSENAEDTLIMFLALLLYSVLALMIIFVHFYVALQVFVISIEFYIICTITTCFVPFALNKHLSYLTTGAINAVIASAVKLGVLMMILGLMGDPIAQMTLSSSPTLYEMLSLLLGSAMMAYLVSKAPSIAQAVFNGGGAGIDVGAMVSTGAAMAATAVAGGAAGAMGASAAWQGVAERIDTPDKDNDKGGSGGSRDTSSGLPDSAPPTPQGPSAQAQQGGMSAAVGSAVQAGGSTALQAVDGSQSPASALRSGLPDAPPAKSSSTSSETSSGNSQTETASAESSSSSGGQSASENSPQLKSDEAQEGYATMTKAGMPDSVSGILAQVQDIGAPAPPRDASTPSSAALEQPSSSEEKPS